MLFRFCLYGFLKNQRYFEPFLFLAFREKGLSFFQIGLLIGFREICVNLLEVPTGAMADAVGRRKAMMLSHVAYAGSFVVFGLVAALPFLFGAMFLFSLGEAFRTGTHKAIIFTWLEHEGRAGDRTRTYGYTRSWSKMGSALSVLLAAGMVVWLRSYEVIFWLSAIPAGLNVVNFMTYPSYLDGDRDRRRSVGEVWQTLWSGLGHCLRHRPLRGLLLESMAFEGVYKVSKDYLQPLLRQVALALPLLVAAAPEKRTALLVGVVYALLHVLSSVASRKADRVRQRAGSEARALRLLWLAYGMAFAGLLAGGTAVVSLSIAAFIVLGILQNLWRPVMIGAVASHASQKTMATILSVESQAKALFAAVLAPALGLCVDAMPADWRFAPIGVLGLGVATLALARRRGPDPRNRSG